VIATRDWLDEVAIAERRARQAAAGPVAERRILLHLGPHKTGSAFMQRMAEFNIPRLPPGMEVIERINPDLLALREITKSLRSADQARRCAPEITATAARLERWTQNAAQSLVSHEALLGATPGRHGIRGLYPFIETILPAMLEGLAGAGAAIEIALYERDFAAWMRSNDAYRRKKEPFLVRTFLRRPFSPVRYAARHGLTAGWDDLHRRIRAAAGGRAVHVFSFEEESRAGLLGAGLWRLMGLSGAEIAGLERIAPQNVTNPAALPPHAAQT